MILNPIEYPIVNSRLSDWHLDREVRRLKELSDLPTGKKVLEIGCGRGAGARFIKKYFQASKVTAIDIDERMIGLAKGANDDPSITLELGDARKMHFPNRSFDAAFDFGVLHHIPDWRKASREVHRVLKPGGRLIIEDLSLETFESGVGRVLKPLLEHPYQDMYRQPDFLTALKKLGFQVQQEKSLRPAFLFKYFIVLARKKSV